MNGSGRGLNIQAFVWENLKKIKKKLGTTGFGADVLTRHLLNVKQEYKPLEAITFPGVCIKMQILYKHRRITGYKCKTLRPNRNGMQATYLTLNQPHKYINHIGVTINPPSTSLRPLALTLPSLPPCHSVINQAILCSQANRNHLWTDV